MSKALTAKAIEKFQPDPERRREVPDGLLPGLYLVVQPSGAKSWAVRYRANGKPAKLTLGRFPAIKLSKARELARDNLEAVAKGSDPAAEKRAGRAASGAVSLPNTVGALCDLYIERHLKPNVRRWEKSGPSAATRWLRNCTRNSRAARRTTMWGSAWLSSLSGIGFPKLTTMRFRLRMRFNILFRREVTAQFSVKNERRMDPSF